MIAVHAHAVAEVHALPVDEAERLHARGERARPVPRRERRVRRLALEGEVEAGARQRDVRQEIAIERVEHHRRVDAAEDARLEQRDLAAAAFLGGRADELDRALEPRGVEACSARKAPSAPRGDQVVAARVPDLGKRVVLGEDGDLGALCPIRCARETRWRGRPSPLRW